MENILKKMEKYNCWDGKMLQSGYEREVYLNKISGYSASRLVKVLVGQRRCGKSYILRQIINKLIINEKVNPKNIFYLNKEYIIYDEIRSVYDLENLFSFYKKAMNVQGKIYIFLDEIQNINSWERFVNSYAQDYSDEYELYITGSNSKMLSGELASLLSGRYIEFEIFPFNLFEYAGIVGKNIDKKLYINYLQTGGLPEIFNLKDEEQKRHYIESLKNTIILRDIVQKNKVKDIDLLDDIFNFIITNIGNYTSITSIVKYFKNKQKITNYETLSAYLNYLEESFIIHKIDRYNIRGKQFLGGERKYYLNDLSFKNFLFGFFPSDIGYNLENYIFIQLKSLGYHVSTGLVNDKETDFVAKKTDKTLYIQVCYLLESEKTIEREFGNLLAIKDNHEKIVVSLDDIKYSNYEGIKHIWPWELI